MRPPILALVIGINEYQCFPQLAGAVADADAFEEFLKDTLGVPSADIISLRDAEASRQAIVNGFTTLRDNPKFGKDECAIVIYFAGHGAQVDKPPGWEDWQTPTGKIEILCPSDYGVERSGILTQGIPDRTISKLVNHISDIKGNNITLIFDCCHSGGLHRKSEDATVRRIDSPPQLDPDVDKKLVPPSFRSKGASSARFIAPPVVLAACGRDKQAMEKGTPRRGIFTSALLEVLDKEDLHNLTYLTLIHKLKMTMKQTPHCEGVGIQWRLFNNREPGADDCYILTKVKLEEGSENSIILHAGEAQGVTLGSRFSVHATNLTPTLASPNELLGYLTVAAIDAFTSTMEKGASSSVDSLPKICYSKLVERALQRTTLFCDDKEWLESVFPPQTLQELSAEIVEDAKACDLQLSILDDMVYFDSHNVLVEPHLGSRNRYSIAVGEVPRIREVVRCWIHFHYHLMRGGPNEFRNVWMELKTLQRELTDDNEYVFKPIGKNLIEDDPATVIVDENASLGLTLFNKTDLPLYPYVFYFDPSELSIFEWYKPPYGAGRGMLTTKVDAPLSPQKSLTLGYGDGGVSPMRFFLPQGQEKDLGFFKLFLCTQPTYFDSIRQKSPFDTEDPILLGSRGGKSTHLEPPEEIRWGTHLRTFIQIADA